jgi:hypothetical protein
MDRLLEPFRSLLSGEPSEEEVHQFLEVHSRQFGLPKSVFGKRIAGVLSKFPITPDRIPDFTVIKLNGQPLQFPSRIQFIELKKPSARLYVDHARMSKELNDAWMECIETTRLLGPVLRDFLRRAVKTVYAKSRQGAESAPGGEPGAEFYMRETPVCGSTIVIGRRSTLDTDAILRTQELSAACGQRIKVITYDTILEELDQGYQRWWGGWLW